MTARPVDASGDILPVLSPGGLLSGPAAVAEAVRNSLRLNTGDWWEDPSRGLPLLELLRSVRLTEADLPAVTNLVAACIAEVPEVLSVSEVTAELTGHQVSVSARIRTAGGSTVRFASGKITV